MSVRVLRQPIHLNCFLRPTLPQRFRQSLNSPSGNRSSTSWSSLNNVSCVLHAWLQDCAWTKIFCCDRTCILQYCKMSTRLVRKYHGNGTRCLWLLFMVTEETEVRQRVFWTRGRFAAGVHFSVVLWPVLQTELSLEEASDISFESSLSRFLFFVLGPICESWDRFLFFSLNFPEDLRSFYR